MGILVWQDFMFACGSYPTWPGLLQTIEDEAVYNCRRLRHHPSIALLCGSNEDYQIQEWYGLDYQQTDDPQEWLKSTFPARYIYEYLLPKVVAAEVPGTRYWPCSPYTGGGKNSGDLTIGDIHMWDGKFVSSYKSGPISHANDTISKCGITNKKSIRNTASLEDGSTVNLDLPPFRVWKPSNLLSQISLKCMASL